MVVTVKFSILHLILYAPSYTEEHTKPARMAGTTTKLLREEEMIQNTVIKGSGLIRRNEMLTNTCSSCQEQEKPLSQRRRQHIHDHHDNQGCFSTRYLHAKEKSE